jgi:hypothetical protein
MARVTSTEFDIAMYMRESTAASGVPERLEDPDAIYDATVLLAGVKLSRSDFPVQLDLRWIEKPGVSRHVVGPPGKPDSAAWLDDDFV